MGIIKRQGLKSSIVNYVGVLIGVIFFNFVFPNLVSEKYIGLINLLRNLTYVFAALPALGLGQILLNYFNLWEDDKTKSSFNGFAIFSMLLAVLIFSLLYIIFKESLINYYHSKSPLFTPYFFAIIPMVLFFTFNQYIELFAVVKYRSAFPAFLREVVSRIILIVVFYFFIYNIINLNGLIVGLVLTFAIPFFILLFYVIKVLDFKVSSFHYYKQRAEFKTETKYAKSMLLLVIFSTATNFLDGIILPAYLGLEMLGIYTISLVLGQMIQVPYRAITLISIPVIRETIANKDFIKLKQLNNSLGINLFLIGCFLFTLLVSNTDGIFSLLPSQYSLAKNVLIIIALGRLLDMAFGLNSEIISFSNNYKFIVRLSGLMFLMTIVLNIILIPILGMNGAALAVSISLIVFNLLKTFIIYKKYHFHCFSKHYITLLLISIFVIGVLYFVPFLQFVAHHKFLNSLMNIAFKSTIGIILFLIPTYLFKISNDFNDFLKLVLSGKILKGGHKMENL